MMSTMRPGVLEVAQGGGTVRIFVRGGFADVSTGGLTVLAEQAIPLDNLDDAVLAQEVRNAEEDVADAKDGEVKAAAELKLYQLKEVQAALRK
jgi:F-type H+-transporting ATPase subunit epsilon